ncbi:formamidopyrimidine-DNA glycosylase [Myxococcota bacterium]|nr:formamidopyrimidine-DNA glycosylase [Myxococcota bacterium]
MPELPDIVVYVEHLERRVCGQPLEKIRFASPFLLRSVKPPLAELYGERVTAVRRLGKRIVFALEAEHFLVLHLMIAGRLRWKEAGAKIPGKIGLAAFDFPNGTLVLTEASTKKRASLYAVAGEAGLAEHSRGGLEVLDATIEQFDAALRRENHTVKRSLTDPRLFSGIGNAYSDEILHRARMSPMKLTSKLDAEEVARLFEATKTTLVDWTNRLRAEAGDTFPENVTAFREGMAVHGRYKQPCPDCGSPVQRVAFADNELDYCARCQTGGKLLADRSLSRLLKEDWPKTLDDLEK